MILSRTWGIALAIPRSKDLTTNWCCARVGCSTKKFKSKGGEFMVVEDYGKFLLVLVGIGLISLLLV